jgi:hypothetical protein
VRAQTRTLLSVEHRAKTLFSGFYLNISKSQNKVLAAFAN